MIYREAGQFKTTYASDQAIFPVVQDRWVVAALLAAAVVVPTALASEYWLQAILIPFLIYALAALGLNILTGYAGQLSLGAGGFMAVGGYAAFKLTTAFPGVNILVVFLVAGLFAEGRVVSQSASGIVVPTNAVNITDPAMPWVLRVNNGRTERVNVTLGLRDPRTERVNVASGLNEGDVLLRGASQGISPGTAVRVSTTK